MKAALVFFLAITMSAAFSAAPAQARAKINLVTKYYPVSGKTGLDLFNDMNRRGPRHAFMKKAMAQTQYRTTPRGSMSWKNGVCRVENGGYIATITYVYPKPAQKLPPDLARRWSKFMAHTISHEKTHGRIAVELVNALDSKMRRFSMRDNKGCRNAMGRLARDVKAIYSNYEKRQVTYDEREHKKGGAVEKSVITLVKN